MSIARQCALLGVARSSLYYRSKEPSGENLALMQAMDRQYLDTPFYGSRRMKVWLAREGRRVSRKRVQRLMRITALRARRYDSTWYIPGTIHGVDYDPMDGTDLSSQSAIYPPAWSDLTPPITGGLFHPGYSQAIRPMNRLTAEWDWCSTHAPGLGSVRLVEPQFEADCNICHLEAVQSGQRSRGPRRSGHFQPGEVNKPAGHACVASGARPGQGATRAASSLRRQGNQFHSPWPETPPPPQSLGRGISF